MQKTPWKKIDLKALVLAPICLHFSTQINAYCSAHDWPQPWVPARTNERTDSLNAPHVKFSVIAFDEPMTIVSSPTTVPRLSYELLSIANRYSCVI